MKNNNKLVPFKQNIKFFLNHGIESAISGQYLKSLSYFFHALNEKPGNVDIMLHIAVIYQKMNLIDTSNAMLFNVLSMEHNNENACILLGQNFSILDDTVKELYYLKNFSDLTDDTNIMEIFEKALLAPRYEQVYPLPNEMCEVLKASATKHFVNGEIKEAEKEFEEILLARPNDLFARNSLCQIYLVEKKFLIVVDYEKQVLSLEHENVFALCNLCLAYHNLGDLAEKNKIILKLKNLKTKSEEDTKRIVRLMCCINEHNFAGILAQKCLTFNEFDVDYIAYAAIAFYNAGQYEKSKEFFLRMDKIFPNTLTVDYYLKLVTCTIDGDCSPKVLKYELELPIEEEEKIKDKLSNMCIDDVWDDRKLQNLLSWLFNSGAVELISSVLDKLIDNDLKRSKKVLAKLLAQNYSNEVKSLVIFKIMTQLPKGRFFINKENFFMKLDLPRNDPPQNLSEHFWKAFSVLSVLFLDDDNWIEKLSNSAEEVSSGLSNATAEIDQSVLPAIIVRNALLNEFDEKLLCKLFKVTYNQLVQATDIIFN